MIAEILKSVDDQAAQRNSEVILRAIELRVQVERAGDGWLIDGIIYSELEVRQNLSCAGRPHGVDCRCASCIVLAVYTGVKIKIHRLKKIESNFPHPLHQHVPKGWSWELRQEQIEIAKVLRAKLRLLRRQREGYAS